MRSGRRAAAEEWALNFNSPPSGRRAARQTNVGQPSGRRSSVFVSARVASLSASRRAAKSPLVLASRLGRPEAQPGDTQAAWLIIRGISARAGCLSGININLLYLVARAHATRLARQAGRKLEGDPRRRRLVLAS